LTTNFDTDMAGQSPAGWNCGITGRGHPHWTVEADASDSVTEFDDFSHADIADK
jgi:hypothetical protein